MVKTSKAYLKQAVILFLICFFVSSGGRVYSMMYSELMASGFSMSYISITNFFSTASVFAASMLLPVFLKRMRVKNIILMGGIMMGLATIVVAAAAGLKAPILLFVRAPLMGASLSLAGTVPFSIIIKNWFKSRYSLVMSIILMGLTLGTAMYSPIYGELVPVLGFDVTVGMIGFVELIVAVILSLMIKETPESCGMSAYESAMDEVKNTAAQTKRLDIPAREARKSILYVYILLLAVMIVCSITSIQSLLPTFVQVDAGMTLAQSSHIYSILMIVATPAMVFGGYIADRFSLRTYMVSAISAFLAGMLLLLLTNSFATYIMGTVLIGIACPLSSLSLTLLMNDAFGEDAYKGLAGSVTAIASVSVGILLVIIGSVFDTTGTYYPSFICLAITGAITLLMILLYQPLKLRVIQRKERGCV